VEVIPDGAFQDCDGLINLSIGNSVKTIGHRTFYRCSNLESVNIPNSVTKIKGGAFNKCEHLSSLTIGNSVEKIEEGAFGSSGLAEVTIPESVTEIGEYAFAGCLDLATVNYNAINAEVGDGNFSINPRGGVSAITTVTIGEKVENIPDDVFSGCTVLETVNYNAKNAAIGTNNFAGKESITTVNIGEEVEVIPAGAFEGCTGLETLVIPDNVLSIGDNAFADCSGLTSIVIGASVASIGDGAFAGCSAVGTITSWAEVPPVIEDEDIFNDIEQDIPVYVPCGSKAAYQVATGWKYFTNYHTISGDTVAVTRYICIGSTYSDDAFEESEEGTYYNTITGSAGCDSVITLTLAYYSSELPSVEFPETVDACDGGDILVILTGTPPFTVEYLVSEGGKAAVTPDKFGLKNIFGEGGYPLTKIGDKYSAIIPSGSAKILTFEKISIVDGNGCKGK
jgi:hypothetical protein